VGRARCRSDERTGLSFTIAAGPHQCSHSRVRVPWNSRPHFTVPDPRLPLSSPPATRRAAVEVFDPASTRDLNPWSVYMYIYPHMNRTSEYLKRQLSAVYIEPGTPSIN
jgi:hypothetical protein